MSWCALSLSHFWFIEMFCQVCLTHNSLQWHGCACDVGREWRTQVYPRSTRNVSLQTLGFRLGLNLGEKNVHRNVYRNHMGYALTISYSMSGMQLVNNVDHRNLETLWVPGNGVNALWALNRFPLVFLLLWKGFAMWLTFFLWQGRYNNNSFLV